MAQSRAPTGLSTNFKTYVRVRATDYQSKMIEYGSDSTLNIRDPTSKQKDKQSFAFNGVYDNNTNQETIWAHVAEPAIQKVIEGSNSCILCYGQTGSGKTYSIFGEDESYSVSSSGVVSDGRKDKRGLVPRTVEHLFRKAKELEDIREFVITCSMTEIYLDQVRDLGKPYLQNQQEQRQDSAKCEQAREFIPELCAMHLCVSQLNLIRTASNCLNLLPQKAALTSNFENEKLTIFENTNGQIAIKDLTLVQVKSLQELYSMIQAGFQLRDKFVTKSNQIWARAHTIFSINVVQKDKENENIPFMNSTIQFVDLAGSERIAKSLTEGHKFEETILINTSLTALGKCLQCIARGNKTIPYKESQMTRVLQNCMGIGSYVTLLITLHPGESNYDECLSSLQFAERTKQSPQTNGNGNGNSNGTNGNNSKNSHGGNAPGNSTPSGAQAQQAGQQDDFMLQNIGNFAGNDKMIKSLKDQIKDLETKIDFISRENKSKMMEVQNILGLDVDLDKILSRSSVKDLQQFKMQRESVAKLDNIQKQNKELEEEIAQLHKNIESIQREEALKQERQSGLVQELKDQVKKLKDEINASKHDGEEQLRKLNLEREEEVKSAIEKSNQQLESQSGLILHLSNNVQNKTNENLRVIELKRNARAEVEKELKNQVDILKNDYAKMIETSKTQFETLLKHKNEQLDHYDAATTKYKHKKRQEIDVMKKELLDLYDIAQQQTKLIGNLETGQFSGGKKQFNIPSRDKPNQPNRSSFSFLFKLMDQRTLRAGNASSSMNSTIVSQAPTAAYPKTDMYSTTMGTATMNNNQGTISATNNNYLHLQTDQSKKNALSLMAIGGKSNLLSAKTSQIGLKKANASTTFQSTLLSSNAFKSQAISAAAKEAFQTSLKEETAFANKSIKEKIIQADVNVDLSVNLQKIKTKEEFPQLKVYAQRLKEQLHGALMREKELKERVEEFEQINTQVDIKQLQAEISEYKQLYMQEARKNNSASRGSSVLEQQSSRKLFMTGIPQSAGGNQSSAYQSQQFQQTADWFPSRPQTNQLASRQNNIQQLENKQLVPLKK